MGMAAGSVLLGTVFLYFGATFLILATIGAAAETPHSSICSNHDVLRAGLQHGCSAEARVEGHQDTEIGVLPKCLGGGFHCAVLARRKCAQGMLHAIAELG